MRAVASTEAVALREAAAGTSVIDSVLPVAVATQEMSTAARWIRRAVATTELVVRTVAAMVLLRIVATPLNAVVAAMATAAVTTRLAFALTEAVD